MTGLLEWFANPLVAIGIAIAVFSIRVIFLARRLRSAANRTTLADLRALEEAKRALDAHKDSLDAAKGALSGNIEGARDTLRHYREPLARARIEKRKVIADALNREALKSARRLYQASPKKRKRVARRPAPKDI